MFSVPTLVSLLLLAVPHVVYADPCVAFDAEFNLLAFGLNGKDWNAGQQSSWGSGSATDITASGRPPFDGTGTTCYLAQFFNAIYVLNGDKSNPSDVHIYDAAAKSWTTQKTNTNNFDLTNFAAILDHDTNVFYALSKGDLWFLDMSSLKAATSSVLPWTNAETSPYGSDYQPTMALAQNHVHFIGTPGTPAGSAEIFVIHFSFFQPQAQAYSGPQFPATHGQTTSFFQSEGVQQEFAFIPDDFSNVYVINVESNTTTTLAAPPSKDTNARYASSITALVQLDSTGAVSFVPYKQGDASTNSAATWSSVAPIAAVAGTSSGSSSAAASGTSTGSSGSKTSATGSGAPAGTRLSGTASATGASASTTGTSNGAMSNAVSFGAIAGVMLAVLAYLH
ncbi:hypothetical protein BD310DRAFT_420351 [Dichomitus squalens]|uniref:Uncharacterized protein n=1 Tax=Dichomitus squalens TaxID=114155 RepID=A0A4Q9PXS0_9APHY|nr:hypothetical protein BD310DRAFT_420351 [Dichomitus squalens]